MIVVFILSGTLSTKAQEKIDSIDSDSFQKLVANPTKPIGRTDFNLADRIAVQNLLAAYCMTYDEGKMEAHADLFWPEAEFIVQIPKREDIAMAKDSWVRSIDERIRVFKEINYRRRHVMGKERWTPPLGQRF